MRRALTSLAVLAALAGPARAASLEVVVEGGEPYAGEIYVTLCQGGLSESACPIGRSAQAPGGGGRFVFSGVTPGIWAVAAFQDSNGNGRLDRTGLGLPLEPYGFSGAVGRRARPDFADARFSLSEPGASIRVRLARPLPRR